MTMPRFFGKPLVLRLDRARRIHIPSTFRSVIKESDDRYRRHDAQLGLYQLYIPQKRVVRCYTQKDYEEVVRRFGEDPTIFFTTLYKIDKQGRTRVHYALEHLEEIVMSPAGQSLDLYELEFYPFM